MAQLQALLQIKADVQGEGQIDRLGRSLGGLQQTAGKVSGGLKGLMGAAGGLTSALGGLVPMVSGVGLTVMAKGAIDTADAMSKMSQRTGVSVERLTQIKQAAELSDTSIEAVGKSLAILSKNMSTENKGAMESLEALGISATDSAGKMRSADAILLDVMDRFKQMPDGVEKTAMAMQLFGKSGADMIPLLNGGRESIESLKATISGDFAAKAAEFNDQLTRVQESFGQIGLQIGEAVLPAFTVLADVLVVASRALSDLPGPVQAVVVGVGLLLAGFLLLAPAISAIVSLAGVLAGLQIGATIAGWAGAIGPAVAAITSAFSGLLAYLTGTMLPALLAFFSGPAGWTVLAVAAVVAMAIAFREPIGKFLSWLGGALQAGLKAGIKIAYDILVKPWVHIWDNVLRKPISDLLSWMGNAIRAPFEAAANFVKGIIRGILQTIANGINAAVGAINRLIGAYNSLPTPDLPLVPTITVPQFAEGGVVNRPTLAMVGEGGEREYIIPESKMAAASARYLSGGRGDAVLSGGAGNSIINIRTGPVMSAQGQQWVTMADLERAVRQTEAGVMARIRTPAGRRALGIR